MIDGTRNAYQLLLAVIGALIVVTGCSGQSASSFDGDSELIVFAAASLAEVMTETAQQFEAANPGAKVILNFAGSQQLAHQLSQGAPADIFASADERQMQAAVDAGRIDGDSQGIFATSRLVAVYPFENPARLKTVSDLAEPGLRLILAAPEVPAGQYALQFLDKSSKAPEFGARYREGVLSNVVSYEENVRAVLSKVRLGEADAGVVYESDVIGKGDNSVGHLIIPDQLNIVAKYPIASTSDSGQPELSQSFIDFVLSTQGQQVLAEYGFAPASLGTKSSESR